MQYCQGMQIVLIDCLNNFYMIFNFTLSYNNSSYILNVTLLRQLCTFLRCTIQVVPTWGTGGVPIKASWGNNQPNHLTKQIPSHTQNNTHSLLTSDESMMGHDEVEHSLARKTHKKYQSSALRRHLLFYSINIDDELALNSQKYYKNSKSIEKQSTRRQYRQANEKDANAEDFEDTDRTSPTSIIDIADLDDETTPPISADGVYLNDANGSQLNSVTTDLQLCRSWVSAQCLQFSCVYS